MYKGVPYDSAVVVEALRRLEGRATTRQVSDEVHRTVSWVRLRLNTAESEGLVRHEDTSYEHGVQRTWYLVE